MAKGRFKRFVSSIQQRLFILILTISLTSIACYGKTDQLSYAIGLTTGLDYMREEDYFWFNKGILPEVTECDFGIIVNSILNALDGHSNLTIRQTNLKIHDFLDEISEGVSVNTDSLAVVYGALFYWEVFHPELMQFEPDAELLIRGLRDGIYANADLLMDVDAAIAISNKYFEIELPAKNLAKSEKYFAEVISTIPGVKHTETGLIYRIDLPGNDERISDQNVVIKAPCTRTLPLGGYINSSFTFGFGRPFNSIQSAHIKEALKLIGVGGKVTIWTLNNTRHGYGPNRELPIIYELELTSIEPM